MKKNPYPQPQPSRSRRRFLQLSGSAVLLGGVPAWLTGSLPAEARSPDLSAQDAVQLAARRLLGPRARQVRFRLLPGDQPESFAISGEADRILIEGSTPSAMMMGLNWFLKYVAGVSASWNGDCLNRLPDKLPLPASSILRHASAPHRFAFNDTNDAYTGPYWSWQQWEREIDILALHGINEVLVYTGAEAVYQETLRKFHYTDDEIRAWLPTPAHQPWWLLQNLFGWVGPRVSQHLIDTRLDLGRRIATRLRELGMTPVLPGYFGTVPNGFEKKNPGSRVIPQGTWGGFIRPGWLDPTCPMFPMVAQEFYRVQAKLFGPSTMFKMDPLHEGGHADGVDITGAAKAVDRQLQRAHPGAIWAILGWQENPKAEVLDGIEDKDRVLILDGQSDRFAYRDRDRQWNGTPYAFGTIWNFGGRTTIGANLDVWNERYFDQLTKPGSKLRGIAIMPEASNNNPAAFAFFSELAWRRERTDVADWFTQWSSYRYGGKDGHAQQAWDVLHATAYSEKSGKWSESHDNLFAAQPSLTTKSACAYGPTEPRYDLAAFSAALAPLLKVPPSLRESSAYRYDLVDVARQTLANSSRVLLPQIDLAYKAGNLSRFRLLTRRWLQQIDLLDRIVGTEPAYLVGTWIASAKAAASSRSEQAQLEFDARSLLLEWGSSATRKSGLHDYANREWQGLLGFYRERWAAYFSMLDSVLQKQGPLHEIDWFAMDREWAKRTNGYPTEPTGNAFQVIQSSLGQIL